MVSWDVPRGISGQSEQALENAPAEECLGLFDAMSGITWVPRGAD